VRHFNRGVYARNEELLESLPDTLDFNQLVSTVRSHGDPQLERLCNEYLPITFGRRHGDPSRPWNRFAIKLKDEFGNRLLSYEGNWRDIFQNWEALTFSYPEFIENVIAKFVNASTMSRSPKTPGAISATGETTRSSIYRSCSSCLKVFIRRDSHICCTSLSSATPMCPTA
jgi:hypothetical protein